MCVDFRNLNKCSKKDNYPLPKMEHLLQKVSGARVMSFLDGFFGYNQVAVHPDDQEKNAFITPWGTFMYAKMPFGLMNYGDMLTPKKCPLPHLPHYMAHLSIFLPYFPPKGHKTI